MISGSKLVADLQRSEIWPIIKLASSELARASRSATGPRPASNLSATSFEPDSAMEFGYVEIARSWSQTGSMPNSITLSWSQTGSKLVADRFEPALNLSATSFEPASNQIA